MKNDLLLIIYIASLFGAYYITEKSSIRWTIKKFYDKTFLYELFVLIKMLIITIPIINTAYIIIYSSILIIVPLIALIIKILKK